MKYKDITEDFAHLQRELDWFLRKHPGRLTVALGPEKYFDNNWPKTLKVEMELNFDD